MKTFYLTGQVDFGNRGCEAIVRSTVAQLRDEFPGSSVLVPTANETLDRQQWPESAHNGVTFVPRYKSIHNKYWRHFQALPIPGVKSLGWPFPLTPDTRSGLADSDAVLSIGGDNYSLDYMIPSLLMGQDDYAIRAGTPVALWGASVGPFAKEPEFERYVKRHLSRMAFIGARETVTQSYLIDELGLHNVRLVADPAFGLAPEEVELANFWPEHSEGNVLGLNVSPLIERYRPKDEPDGRLLDEVATFIKQISERFAVLLIPHVVPLDGRAKNNDAIYMRGLLERLNGVSNVRAMASNLNASQTKFVISRCRYFIGARTHATIAALSSGVPTGSIAYSVKAQGINRDLFGHTRYVLPTPSVDAVSLLTLLKTLEEDEATIGEILEKQLPEWRNRAKANVRALSDVLSNRV